MRCFSIIISAFKVKAYSKKCIRSSEDQNKPKSAFEIMITNYK